MRMHTRCRNEDLPSDFVVRLCYQHGIAGPEIDVHEAASITRPVDMDRAVEEWTHGSAERWYNPYRRVAPAVRIERPIVHPYERAIGRKTNFSIRRSPSIRHAT